MIFTVNDPLANILGEWSQGTSVWAILFRILLSIVFAAIIGWERSTKRHSAGLRTFILVTLAATIAMIIDVCLPTTIPLLSASVIVATAMISGNSILFGSKNQIKGLTTSAGLWTCAIIGLGVGAGLYTAVLIAFVALLVVLSIFPNLERFFKNRSNHFEMHLELKNKDSLGAFVQTIRKLGLRIDDIEADTAYMGAGISVYSVTLSIMSEELKKYKTHSEIIAALSTLDYVSYIEEM